ncbi:UBAP1-MVB12-associated (UMA)-domain containing protein 1 isoform X1 [Phyllostomus discolor]|uniref:UBAP1-MVB12-associated (UMA)-domain containing protein 1 isoform X1 n=1 Tax=Phyllostomus discolor TaxID=89673 RepID=A0A7E6CH61_9CHIR|nr:UBAP1-MVB12-associated (UMA)-domain containing protein 1 isoform X1 [Phyllostomus discolor]
MGQISLAPIGGEQHSGSTNQTRGNLDRTSDVRLGESERREASGSGDLLLSDDPRPGSCPGPPAPKTAVEGLHGWGGAWGFLPGFQSSPPLVDPGSKVSGSGADAAGDCSASLRPQRLPCFTSSGSLWRRRRPRPQRKKRMDLSF